MQISTVCMHTHVHVHVLQSTCIVYTRYPLYHLLRFQLNIIWRNSYSLQTSYRPYYRDDSKAIYTIMAIIWQCMQNRTWFDKHQLYMHMCMCIAIHTTCMLWFMHHHCDSYFYYTWQVHICTCIIINGIHTYHFTDQIINKNTLYIY